MKNTMLSIAALLLSAGFALAQTAAPAETVSLTAVQDGPTITVTVTAASPVASPLPLYGYQFDVKFDPTALQASDIQEGSSFSATKLSDFDPGAIDNVKGTIASSYDTLQSSAPTVANQAAQLAVIHFKPLQVGNTNVTLQSPVLVDNTGRRMQLNVPSPLSINIPDTAPPVVTPAIAGTLGSNGWYTSAVTVSWSESDQSAVTSPLCGATTITADTNANGQAVSCSATNGGGFQTTQSVTIKKDATPPVISGVPAPGSCVLTPPNYKLVTVATVTASDALSGLAPGSVQVSATSSEAQAGSQPDIVIKNGVVQLRAAITGKSRTYTITATASDLAGNKARAQAQCTVKP
jgi:Cohesin domain